MDSEQLYSNILEGSTNLIHSTRPDGSFEFVNQAWKDTLGYTEEETDEMTIERIIFPEMMTGHKQMLESVFDGNQVGDFSSIFVSKDGELVYVEGNIFPRFEGSEVVAAQSYYRDITEKREAMQRIEEERKRFEFLLDLMIHDITNINQEITTTFELIIHHPDMSGDIKEIVEEGLEEVERGSKLISTVRKISLIEERRHSLEKKDLGKAILDAAAKADSSFPEKEMKLDTNAKNDKYFIMADEFLEDVFLALLHNSMKFDQRKEVDIDVQIEGISHTPFLRIDIKDRGPGIPDEDKDDVFAEVKGRREGILGLGLGLTLVKKVLENYGGQIRVEDRVQGDHTKGADFVILLRREYETDSNRGD